MADLLNSASLYLGENTGQKIYARAQNLVHQRFVFNTVYQEIAELVNPQKANVLMIRWPGTLTQNKIFDCTAIQARQRLSSALQSTLMNDSIPWFDLVTPDEELMRRESVRRWLSDSSMRMFNAMQQSNMAMANNEAFDDIVMFGSALVLEEEFQKNARGFGGLIFQAFHVSEYVWDVDPFGQVNEVYRQLKMNAADMAERWGYDNLPKVVREACQLGNIDKMWRVIHAVFPREDSNYFGITSKMPWQSVYILVDSQDRDIIEISGFKNFPYLTPRWSKASDECYGRSPAIDVLPDIRTINRIVELELRSMSRAVNPPIVTTDDGSLGGSLTLKPGGIAYIRQGSELSYLESKANFAAVNIKKMELQDSIRKSFFIDQLMLPPAQGTPMTATEINRRMEQMYAIMGPEMSRLVTEFLRPCVKRTFYLMAEANAFLPAPPELLQAFANKGGKPVISVNFKGPLARSQKMSDVVASERWVNEIIGPLAQVDRDILDLVDTDALGRIGAERLGVPFDILRKSEDVDKIRKIRNQQLAQNEAMRQRNEALQAAGRAAPAIEAMKGAGTAQEMMGV